MTSLDPNLLDLIEQYVSDEMNESERLKFESKLSNEQELEDALEFFLLFESEKDNFGRILFKENLQKIDAEMESQTVGQTVSQVSEALKKKWLQLANTLNKSIDEVASWFEPIPEYELLISSNHRSHQSKTTTPPSGKDHTSSPLAFTLNTASDYLLTIENNRRQQIGEYPIPKNTPHFSLNVSSYPAGRYYWKLVDLKEENMSIGDFLAMPL